MAGDDKTARAVVIGGLAGVGLGASLALLLSARPAAAAPESTKLDYIATLLENELHNNELMIDLLNAILIKLGGEPIVAPPGEGGPIIPIEWISKEPTRILTDCPIRIIGVTNTERMADCRKVKAANTIYIKVESSLDQAISLQPVGNMDDNFTLATTIGLPQICLPNGNFSFGISGQNWAPFIGLRITTAIAPATGFVNVWVTLQEQ